MNSISIAYFLAILRMKLYQNMMENTAKSYILFNMKLTAATGSRGTSFAGNLTPNDTGIRYLGRKISF